MHGNIAIKRYSLIFTVGLLIHQPLYSEVIQNPCYRFYQKAEYSNALTACQQAAEKGDARSQTVLGELYDQGLGVEKNPQLAAYWWKSASQQDDIEARNLLAMKYFYGGDVFGPQPGWPQNYQRAFKLWQQSATQGVAASQFMLGVMYMQGQGVNQDYPESYAWFTIALQGGYKLATDTLVELSRLMTPAQKKAGQKRITQLQVSFSQIPAK